VVWACADMLRVTRVRPALCEKGRSSTALLLRRHGKAQVPPCSRLFRTDASLAIIPAFISRGPVSGRGGAFRSSARRNMKFSRELHARVPFARHASTALAGEVEGTELVCERFSAFLVRRSRISLNSSSGVHPSRNLTGRPNSAALRAFPSCVNSSDKAMADHCLTLPRKRRVSIDRAE
jgi:hypothetical protein